VASERAFIQFAGFTVSRPSFPTSARSRFAPGQHPWDWRPVFANGLSVTVLGDALSPNGQAIARDWPIGGAPKPLHPATCLWGQLAPLTRCNLRVDQVGSAQLSGVLPAPLNRRLRSR
jgi:hypothetical protein